jgi:hypothetical protein
LYEQDQAAPEAPPSTFPVSWTNEFRVANWRRSITRDRTLTVHATAVGCVLADYMDNARAACWPSLETIAAEAGCSKSTVQRAIADLEDAGYLKVKRGRPNRYFAVDATLVAETDVVAPTNVVPGTNVVTLTSEVVEANLSALKAEREEVLPSVGLPRCPNESEGALALGLTPRPAPESDGHRENTGDTEKPGSLSKLTTSLVQQDKPLPSRLDPELAELLTPDELSREPREGECLICSAETRWPNPICDPCGRERAYPLF